MGAVDLSAAKTYGDALTALDAELSLLTQAQEFDKAQEAMDEIEIAMASVTGLQAMFLSRPVTDTMIQSDKDKLDRSIAAVNQAYVDAGGKIPGINTSLDPYQNAVTDVVNKLPIPKLPNLGIGWSLALVLLVIVVGLGALYYFTNRRVAA